MIAGGGAAAWFLYDDCGASTALVIIREGGSAIVTRVSRSLRASLARFALINVVNAAHARGFIEFCIIWEWKLTRAGRRSWLVVHGKFVYRNGICMNVMEDKGIRSSSGIGRRGFCSGSGGGSRTPLNRKDLFPAAVITGMNVAT